MVIGMVLAAMAYTVAGFVQISIDKADTSVNHGHAKVAIQNILSDKLQYSESFRIIYKILPPLVGLCHQ